MGPKKPLELPQTWESKHNKVTVKASLQSRLKEQLKQRRGE